MFFLVIVVGVFPRLIVFSSDGRAKTEVALRGGGLTFIPDFTHGPPFLFPSAATLALPLLANSWCSVSFPRGLHAPPSRALFPH